MIYLLDASVLITANNTYYPLDRVPEFWEWLVHQGEQGLIKIPREIYEEITDGSDDLAKWAKRGDVEKALVLDEVVGIEEVRTIIEKGYAPNLNDEELVKVGRDPFLIAAALVDPQNRRVVTAEVPKPTRTRANRKVPDVCADFGIASLDTFELMKNLDFHTNWK